MLNHQKINELRSKINIPLAKAIQLLKHTDNSIPKAIALFHQGNLAEICNRTECDFNRANELYMLFNYDMEKVINKIKQDNQHQETLKRIITIRDDKIRHREIGFDFYGEDENCNPYSQVDNFTFIPDADFSYIIKEFKKVFPIYDYWSQSEQDQFEICWHNTFDKPTCQKISQNIRNLKHDDPKVLQFFQDISNWLDERLTYAHHIVVEGNI